MDVNPPQADADWPFKLPAFSDLVLIRQPREMAVQEEEHRGES
jgi:hypothetical protein